MVLYGMAQIYEKKCRIQTSPYRLLLVYCEWGWNKLEIKLYQQNGKYLLKRKQGIVNYVTLWLQICDWADPQAATLRTSILVNTQNWFSAQKYNTAMFSSAAFLLWEGAIMKLKWLSKARQKYNANVAKWCGEGKMYLTRV